MIRLITRFFDDIHRLANASMIQREVTLSKEDREAIITALTNYRRNKPRAKKETVNGI